jgi:Fe-S-cluster-containing dehydrogenase component
MAETNENMFFNIHEISLCAGCSACEIVCGLVHEGKVGPCVRRIFLDRDTILLQHRVYTCQHCSDHPCYNACPKKEVAMRMDEERGIVYIDPEGCNGCQLCLKACPFEPKRINFDKTSRKPLNATCVAPGQVAQPVWNDAGAPHWN